MPAKTPTAIGGRKERRVQRRVVESGTDRHENHRPDFETCPDCGHEMDRDQWEKTATTLILSPRIFKSGHAAVMSECSKCFAGSWVHARLMYVSISHESWPKEWHDAAEEREKVLRLKVVREWPLGLCWNCKNLDSAELEYTCWRRCTIGLGPMRKECDAFQPLNNQGVGR